MSIRVMNWVWTRSPEKGSALLMLLAIADHADDDGVAYPSVARLAKKTRLSERATQYIVRHLEVNGALKIERGAGPNGCNVFRVQGLQGALFGSDGVQNSAERGATAIAPESSRTIKEPSKKGDVPSPEFETAWKALPGRGGANNPKLAAWKAWKARIRAGVKADAMLAGAQRYRAFCDATGKTGTEHAMQGVTFFGPNGTWEQPFELPPEKPTVAPATDWWTTPAGIEAKGAEHGVLPQEGEDRFVFKCRVFAAVGDGPWIDSRNVTERRLVDQFRERETA